MLRFPSTGTRTPVTLPAVAKPGQAQDGRNLMSPESTGRPRDPSLDGAVLAAAADLLGETGYRALTMDAVAARAGTSKTAIYRRWDGKTSLVVDVLAARLPAPTPPPSTG